VKANSRATEALTTEVGSAQRRVIRTLVLTQTFGGVGVTTGIAVSSLLAAEIVDSDTLSGLPQTAQVVGAALMAVVLARIMERAGRRPGLVLGYFVALTGGGLCVVAALAQSFAVLLAGTLLLGSATAVNSMSRYAATDLAAPAHRARDLSIVVWATTVGAVLGPNLVGPAGDAAARWGIEELAGPYLVGMLGLLVATVLMIVFLRPDPLVLARERARAVAGSDAGGDVGVGELVGPGVGDEDGGEVADAPRRRIGMRGAWETLGRHPRAAAAVAAIAAAHTVMVSVMVMTPLHMHHGDAELDIIGFVISVHILGMFAFSPLVGWLADRLGRAAVLAMGAATLVAAVLLAGSTSAGSSTQLTVGLFLLGLGWSFALIASSALLVDAVPLEERPATQGLSDLIMGMAAAVGGAVAGVVVDVWGYDVLNLGAGMLTVVVLGAAMVAWRSPGAGAAPGGDVAVEPAASVD
jgi:MFS family permease